MQRDSDTLSAKTSRGRSFKSFGIQLTVRTVLSNFLHSLVSMRIFSVVKPTRHQSWIIVFVEFWRRKTLTPAKTIVQKKWHFPSWRPTESSQGCKIQCEASFTILYFSVTKPLIRRGLFALIGQEVWKWNKQLFQASLLLTIRSRPRLWEMAKSGLQMGGSGYELCKFIEFHF